MAQPLDFALIKRLREVLDDRPATESELRMLSEQADAWARTVSGQIESSERRIRRLEQNPARSLSPVGSRRRPKSPLMRVSAVSARRQRSHTIVPSARRSATVSN